jgi:ABC-type dipeptide/oligopeptide/nickel transport system permease subunit
MSRRLALLILVVLSIVAASADVLSPAGYEEQFRDRPSESPSRRFPLGTDELGRDRAARLLYGSRISLLLAPATAALATVIACALALISAHAGGWIEDSILMFTDLMASVPLLFVVISVRGLLPLDVEPLTSITITFVTLGLCGWPAAVRVIRSSVLEIRSSEFVKQAAASGLRPWRILRIHAAAALRPLVLAQFCLLIPQFLIAEANLGALGLGITEPMPSLGNLLSDLQNYQAALQQPWRLAPAVLLMIALCCMQFLFRSCEPLK